MGDFYAYIPTVLEINGETIEGTTRLYYASEGRYPGYSVNTYSGGGNITLGDGAKVRDGDTVTVRVYAVAEVVEKIPAEYLPETVATAVSYNVRQNLLEHEKEQARRNIDAFSSYKKEVYFDSEYDRILETGLALSELDITNFQELELCFYEVDGNGEVVYGSYCTVRVDAKPLNYSDKQWFEILLGENTLKRVNGYVLITDYAGELFIHVENNQNLFVTLHSVYGINMDFKYD